MFQFEDLLSDDNYSFTYNDFNFTISKLRAVYIKYDIVHQCYLCLNLNDKVSLNYFKSICTMDFINTCHEHILAHNYFDSDLDETVKFIENSRSECENIANLLLNTNLQLSNSYNDMNHTQMLVFNLGVLEVEKTNNKNKSSSDVNVLKAQASKFNGSGKL